MYTMASAQSYIQVTKTYSGSGVDKTLTLTIHNLSDKEMGIRNQTPFQNAPGEGSYITYQYLAGIGKGSLYSSDQSIMENGKVITFIPPQSSKSYVFKLGHMARFAEIVNKSEIKYIGIYIFITYGIPDLNYSSIFKSSALVPF